jgi:hypothetical protein
MQPWSKCGLALTLELLQMVIDQTRLPSHFACCWNDNTHHVTPYADYCKTSLARESLLWPWLEFMQGDDHWANGKGSRRTGQNVLMLRCQPHCHQTDFATATTAVTTTFLENNIDIPRWKNTPWSDQYWMNSQVVSNGCPIRCIRPRPAMKFVMNFIMLNRMRNLTVDDAVKPIERFTTSQQALTPITKSIRQFDYAWTTKELGHDTWSPVESLIDVPNLTPG